MEAAADAVEHVEAADATRDRALSAPASRGVDDEAPKLDALIQI